MRYFSELRGMDRLCLRTTCTHVGAYAKNRRQTPGNFGAISPLSISPTVTVTLLESYYLHYKICPVDLDDIIVVQIDKNMLSYLYQRRTMFFSTLIIIYQTKHVNVDNLIACWAKSKQLHVHTCT